MKTHLIGVLASASVSLRRLAGSESRLGGQGKPPLRTTQGTALLAVSSGAEALASFAVGVLVARIGGADALGRLAAASALLLAAVTASELGQNVVLTRRTAAGNPEARAGFGASLALKAAASLLLFPVVAWAWPADEARWGILAAMALLVLSSLTISATAVLRGRGGFAQVALASFASAAFGVVGVLVVRPGRLSPALAVLAAAQSAKALVAFGAIGRDARPLWPCRADVRALVTETLPFAGVVGVGVAYLKADVLLLSALAGVSEAGRYAAAARLTEALKLLPTALGAALFPALAAGRWDELRRALAVSAGLAAAVLALALTAGEWIVVAVFGSSFAASAGPLRILAVSFGFSSINAMLLLALYARHEERAALRALSAALAANVLANLALAPSLGATGAAAASLASEVLLTAVYLRLLRRRPAERAASLAALLPSAGSGS